MRDLVVDKTVLHSPPQVHGAKRLSASATSLAFVAQHDDGGDLLAPGFAHQAHNGAFGDLGKREQFALDFQRGDLLATRLDDVGGLAAEDEIHGPLCPMARLAGSGAFDVASDGHVAGLEVAVGGEFGLGGDGVTPVFAEDGRALELDLALAFSTLRVNFVAWFDDFVGVGVDKTGGYGGQRPAYTAVYAV